MAKVKFLEKKSKKNSHQNLWIWMCSLILITVFCGASFKASYEQVKITLPQKTSGIEKIEYVVDGTPRGSTSGKPAVGMDVNSSINFLVKIKPEIYTKLRVKDVKIVSGSNDSLRLGIYKMNENEQLTVQYLSGEELIDPNQTYVSEHYTVFKDESFKIEGLVPDTFDTTIKLNNSEYNISEAMKVSYQDSGSNVIDAEYVSEDNSYVIRNSMVNSKLKIWATIKEEYSQSIPTFWKGEEKISESENDGSITIPCIKQDNEITVQNISKNQYNVMFENYPGATFKYKKDSTNDDFKTVNTGSINAIHGENFSFICENDDKEFFNEREITVNGTAVRPTNGIYSLNHISEDTVISIKNKTDSFYKISLLPENSGAYVTDNSGYAVNSAKAKYGDSYSFKVAAKEGYSQGIDNALIYAVPSDKLTGKDYDVSANPDEARNYLITPSYDGVFTINSVKEPISLVVKNLNLNVYKLNTPKNLNNGHYEILETENVKKESDTTYKVTHGSSVQTKVIPDQGKSISKMNFECNDESVEISRSENMYTLKNIKNDIDVAISNICDIEYNVDFTNEGAICRNEYGNEYENNHGLVTIKTGVMKFTVECSGGDYETTSEGIKAVLESGKATLTAPENPGDYYVLSDVYGDVKISITGIKRKEVKVSINANSELFDIKSASGNQTLSESNQVESGTDFDFKVESKDGSEVTVLDDSGKKLNPAKEGTNLYSLKGVSRNTSINVINNYAATNNNDSSTAVPYSDSNDICKYYRLFDSKVKISTEGIRSDNTTSQSNDNTTPDPTVFDFEFRYKGKLNYKDKDDIYRMVIPNTNLKEIYSDKIKYPNGLEDVKVSINDAQNLFSIYSGVSLPGQEQKNVVFYLLNRLRASRGWRSHKPDSEFAYCTRDLSRNPDYYWDSFILFDSEDTPNSYKGTHTVIADVTYKGTEEDMKKILGVKIIGQTMNGIDESQQGYDADESKASYVLDKNIIGTLIITSNIPNSDKYITRFQDGKVVITETRGSKDDGPLGPKTTDSYSSNFTINNINQTVKTKNVEGSDLYTCTVSTTMDITSTTTWNKENPFKDSDLYLSFFKNLEITPKTTENAKINFARSPDNVEYYEAKKEGNQYEQGKQINDAGQGSLELNSFDSLESEVSFLVKIKKCYDMEDVVNYDNIIQVFKDYAGDTNQFVKIDERKKLEKNDFKDGNAPTDMNRYYYFACTLSKARCENLNVRITNLKNKYFDFKCSENNSVYTDSLKEQFFAKKLGYGDDFTFSISAKEGFKSELLRMTIYVGERFISFEGTNMLPTAGNRSKIYKNTYDDEGNYTGDFKNSGKEIQEAFDSIEILYDDENTFTVIFKNITNDIQVYTQRNRKEYNLELTVPKGIIGTWFSPWKDVNFPEEGQTIENRSVSYQQNVSFIVNAADDYDISKMEVVVTGESSKTTFKVEPINGRYTISSISENLSVKFENISQRKVTVSFTQYEQLTFRDENGQTLPERNEIYYNNDFKFRIELSKYYSNSKIKVYREDDPTNPIEPEGEYYTLSKLQKDVKIYVNDIEPNVYTITLKGDTNAFDYYNQFENGEPLEAIQKVSYGQNFSFKIVPKEGYNISNIKVYDKPASINSPQVQVLAVNGVYTIENISENHTIITSNPEKSLCKIEFRTLEGSRLMDSSGNNIESQIEVNYGSDYSFELSLDSAYSESNPTVTIKGETTPIIPNANGIYTISGIKKNLIVEVSNVTKNAYTATFTPTEGVIYKNSKNKPFTEAQNVEYNGSFYFKISLMDAYDRSVPLVFINGEKTLSENGGVYTLENIRNDVVISVKNVKKNPEEVTMDDVNNVPIEIASENDVIDVVKATLAYNSLNDEEKARVTNMSDLKKAQQKSGEFNHATQGVSISGVDWNIKLVVTNWTENEEKMNDFAKKVDRRSLLSLYEIHLVDVLTNENYEVPYGQKISVNIPAMDLTGYQNIVVAHEKNSGSMEYLDINIVDNTAQFQTSSFSLFGIAAKKIPNYLENPSDLQISVSDLVDSDEELQSLLGEGLSSKLGNLMDQSESSSGNKSENSISSNSDDTSPSYSSEDEKFMINGIDFTKFYNWALDNEFLLVVFILLLGSLTIWLIVRLSQKNKEKTKKS